MSVAKTAPVIAHRKGYYYEVKAGKRYLWCSLRTLQVSAFLRRIPCWEPISADCLQGRTRRGRHLLRLQANRHRTVLRWRPQQLARRLSHR